MKVNEIKCGYVLKLRCGRMVGVYESEDIGLCVSGEEDWFPIDCLDDSLEYHAPVIFFEHHYPDYDVVEVYGRTNPRCACKLTTEDRELLWTREKVKATDPKCGCEKCEECEEETEYTGKDAAKDISELVDGMVEEGFTKSEAMAFLASLIVGGMAMGIEPNKD